ncbi:BTB/POZ domain-containing protein, partial [Drosera capensis]
MRVSGEDLFDPTTAEMSDMNQNQQMPAATAMQQVVPVVENEVANFGFAFDDSNFSDRVLRIEIMAGESDSRAESSSLADWARNCKQRTEDLRMDYDVAVDAEEQVLNQPDTDDVLGYDNDDDEADAMGEDEPSVARNLESFLDAFWALQIHYGVSVSFYGSWMPWKFEEMENNQPYIAGLKIFHLLLFSIPKTITKHRRRRRRRRRRHHCLQSLIQKSSPSIPKTSRCCGCAPSIKKSQDDSNLRRPQDLRSCHLVFRSRSLISSPTNFFSDLSFQICSFPLLSDLGFGYELLLQLASMAVTSPLATSWPLLSSTMTPQSGSHPSQITSQRIYTDQIMTPPSSTVFAATSEGFPPQFYHSSSSVAPLIPNVSYTPPPVKSVVTITLSVVEDYLVWRAQMESFLMSYGFIGFVDGSVASPPMHLLQASSAPVLNPDYFQWQRIDQMVRSWIFATLSRDILV